MNNPLRKPELEFRKFSNTFEDLLSDIELPGGIVWSGGRAIDQEEEKERAGGARSDEQNDQQGGSDGSNQPQDQGSDGNKEQGQKGSGEKGRESDKDEGKEGDSDGKQKGSGSKGDKKGSKDKTGKSDKGSSEQGGDADDSEGDTEGTTKGDGSSSSGSSSGSSSRGGRAPKPSKLPKPPASPDDYDPTQDAPKEGEREGDEPGGGTGPKGKGKGPKGGELKPKLPPKPASPDDDDEEEDKDRPKPPYDEDDSEDDDDITIDDILRGRKKRKRDTINKLPKPTESFEPTVVEPIHLPELEILGKDAAEVLNISDFRGKPENRAFITALKSFAPSLWDVVTYTILNKIKTEASVLKESAHGAIESFTLEELQTIVSREQNLTQATLIEQSLLGAGLKDSGGQSQVITENVRGDDYMLVKQPISTYPILLMGLDNSGSMHHSIHLGEQYLKEFQLSFTQKLLGLIETYIKSGQIPEREDDIKNKAELIASEITQNLLRSSQEKLPDGDPSPFLEIMNRYVQASVWANLPYLLPDNLMEGFIGAVCNIAEFKYGTTGAVVPVPNASPDDPGKSVMYLTKNMVLNKENQKIINEKRSILSGGNDDSFKVGLYYGCLARIIIISTILKNLELKDLLSTETGSSINLSENDIEVINFIFSVMHVTDYIYTVNGFVVGFYEGLLREPELETDKWGNTRINISAYRQAAYESIGWLSPNNNSEKDKFLKILDKFLNKIKILPSSDLLYKVVLEDFDGEQQRRTLLALIMPSLANYLVLRNTELKFAGEASSEAIGKKEVQYASNMNINRSYQILTTTEITRTVIFKDVFGRVMNSLTIIDLVPETLANLVAWIIAYFSYVNKDFISEYRKFITYSSDEAEPNPEQMHIDKALGEEINYSLDKIREAAVTAGKSNEGIYQGLINALFTSSYNVMYRLNDFEGSEKKKIEDAVASYNLTFPEGLNTLQKAVWALLNAEYTYVAIPINNSQVVAAASSSDMHVFKAIVTMPNPNLLRRATEE